MQPTPEIPPLKLGVDDNATYPVRSAPTADSPAFRASLRIAAATEGLLNNGNPSTAAVKETPLGRAMCYAAMGGLNNTQIAEQFATNPQRVSNILRQPWAKTFMTEEFRRLAREDGVMEFLRSEALNSARNLVELRNSPDTTPKVKADIDNSILDRVFGKATQRVEAEQKTTIVEATDEAAKIDAELTALREQVHGRGATNN